MTYEFVNSIPIVRELEVLFPIVSGEHTRTLQWGQWKCDWNGTLRNWPTHFFSNPVVKQC